MAAEQGSTTMDKNVADLIVGAPGEVTDEHGTHIFKGIGELQRAAGDGRATVQHLGWLGADQTTDDDRPRKGSKRWP